ncbi:MAG: tetratricopeptide repeat protein [Planctomycetota bacterium]|nr:tetratricopeptide repeat protein [Planctomycetota bacterium]
MSLNAKLHLPLWCAGCCLTFTGCVTSGQSASNDPFGPPTAAKPGIMQSISGNAAGIGGQIKSMGTAITGAFTKTKDAITQPFTPATNPNADPLSLSNMPSTKSLEPEIWVANGQLYEARKMFDKAYEDYSKALQLQPNNEAALLSMARLHARQSKHVEASQYFEKAIAVAPRPETYSDYAKTLGGMGKNAEALGAASKAIEMDNTNPKYRNNLAGLLVQQGRSEEASQLLQQGGLFTPGEANYNVAYLNFKNNNMPSARQYLQTALQHEPGLQQARDLLNQISNSHGTQAAVAALQTAGNLYRTAEAVIRPQTPANAAVYQVPPASANGAASYASPAPSNGIPSTPTSPLPASARPQLGVPTQSNAPTSYTLPQATGKTTATSSTGTTSSTGSATSVADLPAPNTLPPPSAGVGSLSYPSLPSGGLPTRQ